MAAGKPIRVLANARALIDVLAEQGPMTPAQLSELIGIPRPSIYRLVSGLESISLVETLPDARVRASRRWLHLADASLAGMSEWHGAAALLDDLVELTGQTAFLSVPRKDRAVCVSWAPGRGIGVLALRPGRSLPYYAGAAGRTLLAFAHEDSAAFLRGAPFPALTPRTLVTADDLRADISATRERGYAVSDQDVTIGIAAIGAPVMDATGTTLGALSIGGIAEEISSHTTRYARDLLAIAHELGRLAMR